VAADAAAAAAAAGAAAADTPINSHRAGRAKLVYAVVCLFYIGAAVRRCLTLPARRPAETLTTGYFPPPLLQSFRSPIRSPSSPAPFHSSPARPAVPGLGSTPRDLR